MHFLGKSAQKAALPPSGGGLKRITEGLKRITGEDNGGPKEDNRGG